MAADGAAARRRRLRELWRSAGWPCHDALELELLAAGCLSRHWDAEGRETQLKRLAKVKSERDSADVAAKLAALSRAAEGTDNLMHALIDCANAYCTVGEMVTALKNVWGEFQQPVVF